jgi:RNA polymerase sigma-70 factor, ECF subfamily
VSLRALRTRLTDAGERLSTVYRPWEEGAAGGPPLRLVAQREATEPDDPTLVRGLVAREEWAARAVWNRYAPLVYGVLDRALGSSSESEDLTQEVFWRLFAAIGKLRDPSALRSFIYSCAIRMLRWHLRARRVRRFLSLSESGDVPEQATQASDAEGSELLVRFYAMLDTLSANERTAFTLRQIEGLSLQEIVDATGVSLATVKRRIQRASLQVEKLAAADPNFADYVVRPAGSDES